MSTPDLWPPHASALPLGHALEHVYTYMLYTAHTHSGTHKQAGRWLSQAQTCHANMRI